MRRALAVTRKMPKKREHVTSECGVQYGRLRMGATRNRVAGKSNRQRPERLGSQGRLSEPDAKWLYQTLKGAGGWDRKNERRSLDARNVNVDKRDA